MFAGKDHGRTVERAVNQSYTNDPYSLPQLAVSSLSLTVGQYLSKVTRLLDYTNAICNVVIDCHHSFHVRYLNHLALSFLRSVFGLQTATCGVDSVSVVALTFVCSGRQDHMLLMDM